MELTLLPITALLLLLSGAVGPMRLSGEGAGTVARLCWLGREDAPLATSRNQASRDHTSAPHDGHQASTRRESDAQSQRALSRLRTFSRKLFRTRFGVETATYQAVAPPSA